MSTQAGTRPSPRRFGGAGLLLVGAAYAGYAAVRTGSDPAVLAGWAVTVGLGVLLPGVLVVRAARRAGGCRDGDVAWGAAAGLVLTLLTWAAGLVAHLPLRQPLVGVVVSLALALVPATRRRILRPVERSWGWPSRLVVLGAVVVAVRAASTTGLAWVAPTVRAGSPQLNPDLWFHVAMTGELRHSLVPEYPMVAGTPLEYHWFYYALAAQLGGDGSHDIDVVLRLLPLTLLVILVLVAATTAALVARRRSAAAGAALLVAVVGPVGASLWPATQPFPDVDNAAMLWPVQTYWQWSPTQTLGWVFGVACLGLVVAAVRAGPLDRLEPVWLLGPLVVGAAGAKSVQNVLLAAFLLGMGLYLLTRLRRGDAESRLAVARVVATGALVGVVSLVVRSMLYPGSYGMRLAPGESVSALARALTPGLTGASRSGASSRSFTTWFPTWFTASDAAAVVAVVLWLAPTLLAAVGVAGLFVRRPLRAIGWGAVALAAVGIAGNLLFFHPGRSERFFVVAAMPLLSTLAGAGASPLVVDWWRGRPRRADRLVPLALTVLVAAGATVVLSSVSGGRDPLRVWTARLGSTPDATRVPASTQLTAWLLPWLWIVLATAVAVLVGLAWERTRGGTRSRPSNGPSNGPSSGPSTGPSSRPRSRAATVVVLATVATAASGAVATAGLVRPGAPYLSAWRGFVSDTAANRRPVPVTHALEEAGEYVRTHADPLDVVATNRVLIVPRTADGKGGDPRDFTVSALSGRRTDVAGFAYADSVVEAASRGHVGLATVPFWDPARLAAEQALVTSPSSDRLAAAWRRGTRWIVADERAGPVSPVLRTLADEVFDQDGVHVYRLRPPGA